MSKDAYAFQDACSMKYRPILPTTIRLCTTHGQTAHEIREGHMVTHYTCVKCYEQFHDDLLGSD